MRAPADFTVLTGTGRFPAVTRSMLALLSALADRLREAGFELAAERGASVDNFPRDLAAGVDALVENGLLYRGRFESDRAAAFFTLYGVEAVHALDAIQGLAVTSAADDLIQALRAARDVLLMADLRRLNEERQAIYERLYDFHSENRGWIGTSGKVRIPKPPVERPEIPEAEAPALPARRRA